MRVPSIPPLMLRIGEGFCLSLLLFLIYLLALGRAYILRFFYERQRYFIPSLDVKDR
jgi:hypothetical protein